MNGILQETERTELIPHVALFTEGRPTRLTTIIPETHVIRIETDPVPETYAYHIVRYCELSAWVENPALIVKLLETWGHLPTFSDAIRRIRTGSPPIYYVNNRVWDTCCLALDLPFLNREISRKAIEYFSYPLVAGVKPAGARVLVVKGPEKSGKSFTYDYIRYVNSVFANLNFHIAWVDFRKQVTSRFGPVELISRLLDQVNPNWKNEITLPVHDVQQSSRWLIELVRVLIDQVHSANLQSGLNPNWFLVLDGFSDKKVARDTLDLIQVLAAAATGAQLGPESNDVLRVVLLDFTEPIPNYRNRVRVDDIQAISRADVEIYFQRYTAVKGTTLSPAALAALVDTVFINDDPNDVYRTRKIAEKALAIANTVL